MCLQRPQSVHVGRERHEKDWKNLVIPVSQYMCVGGGGKMFKLLILTSKKIQLIMKISEIKLRRFEAILTPLSSKITVDNGVKMASKRRSFISLIFIINCITKCSLIKKIQSEKSRLGLFLQY